MPKRAQAGYKKKFVKRKRKFNKRKPKTFFKKRVQKIVDRNLETKLATYHVESAYTVAGGTYQIPHKGLIILDSNISYTQQGIHAPLTAQIQNRVGDGIHSKGIINLQWNCIYSLCERDRQQDDGLHQLPQI
jgi:hypothetical protein